MTMGSAILAVVSGVGLWSLCEYLLHRFLGHDKRTWPNGFAAEHTRHHSQGDYFAPSWKKGLAAAAALGVVLPLAVIAAGWSLGALFSGAFVAMYLTYEGLHRRAHTHPGLGRYGRFLRRHHFYHHFADPKSNHGVTSPLWDWLFGTLASTPQLRVPEKLAMVWLVDPQTGEVRPEFRSDYALVRKPR